MSGFFLTSDNPELAEAREEARKKYEERQRKRAEKEAMKKQFLSTLISTGIGMGVSAIGSRMQQRSALGKIEKRTAGTSNAVKRTGSFFKGYDLESAEGSTVPLPVALQNIQSTKMPPLLKTAIDDSVKKHLANFGAEYYMGPFAPGKGKGGGKISGGYMNRDSVPAFLGGGEYVMNNRAVRKYGLGFMGRLNGGLIPGFQGGGSVGAESPTPLNAQSATNTNNISINISMGGEGSGNKAATAEGNENANLESNKDDKTKGKELSERIRAAVVQVISEEQRVGGSLSSTGKGR